MHLDHSVFIKGLHQRYKVRLSFFSQEDQATLTRICAPMDYGPSRRAKDQSDRYHFWDFDSDGKTHVLSLLAERVIGIELTVERFDPAEFITWDTVKSPWFIDRDWGIFS